tara:strand:+ start:357 stop:1187 length:831 start_codon:yes stop_codon:yes gene_type:complete
MKRSIKLTKRIDIDKNNIILEGDRVEAGDGLFYPVINKIDLINENDFPSDAKVFIRFKQNRNTRTFDCGTVGNITPHLSADSFADFIADKIDIRATFNVQEATTTKILGSNKGFKYVFLEGDDSDLNSSISQIAMSPFSIQFADTGVRLWRIGEIDSSDRDVKILFNENITHREPIYTDPMIRNFVLPTVLEKMLMTMINEEGLREDATQNTWPGKLNFLIEKYFPNTPDPLPPEDSDESDKERFINDFIEEFFQKNRNTLLTAALRRIDEAFENE